MKINKQIPMSDWRRVAYRLCRFCDDVIVVNPQVDKAQGYIAPEILAKEFRRYCCVSTPFDLPAAERLVERMGMAEVTKYQNQLREVSGEARASGFWAVTPNRLIVLIDAPRLRANGLPTRPDGSIVFTLLHEMAEIIAAILFAMEYHKYEIAGRRLENWANHFAAHVMMPELEFRSLSRLSGLDVRALIARFGSTVASTTRHIRDLVCDKTIWLDAFYHCRCEFVHNLEGVSPELLGPLEQSNGYCVRTWDAVYSKGLLKRGKDGSLPMYNLAGAREQRIIHPAFRALLEDNTALYIEQVAGAAAFEPVRRYQDLFGLRDLAMLALPYGDNPVKGFILIAVHRSDADRIAPQLEKVSPRTIGELDWLMSSACAKAPKIKRQSKPQKVFDYFCEEGDDILSKQHSFVKYRPLS